MIHRARRAREALQDLRNLGAGALIGAAVVTPVFAASEITGSDWTTLAMLGAVVLLGIGLVLRIRATERRPVVPERDSENSIGRYRPHIYRP